MMESCAKIVRTKGRRPRGKKETEDEDKADENEEIPKDESAVIVDLDTDITQLEAPSIASMSKTQPEPMLRLRWDHKTHLIGEKILNPMIHCCDLCRRPILKYARMKFYNSTDGSRTQFSIPCKHVFCKECITQQLDKCPRCSDRVDRIEKTLGIGAIFMCFHGGTHYGNTGCRRTYLSQRDLQAHVNHRHSGNSPLPKDQPSPQKAVVLKPMADPRTEAKSAATRSLQTSSTRSPYASGSNSPATYKKPPSPAYKSSPAYKPQPTPVKPPQSSPVAYKPLINTQSTYKPSHTPPYKYTPPESIPMQNYTPVSSYNVPSTPAVRTACTENSYKWNNNRCNMSGMGNLITVPIHESSPADMNVPPPCYPPPVNFGSFVVQPPPAGPFFTNQPPAFTFPPGPPPMMPPPTMGPPPPLVPNFPPPAPIARWHPPRQNFY